MKTRLPLVAATLALFGAVRLSAQEAPRPADPFVAPPSSTANDLSREGDAYRFPPIKRIDPRIFDYDHFWLARIARRIQDGTATIPERRSYYGLSQRLFPYDQPVPTDWRQRAQATERSLRPVAAASKTSSPITPDTSAVWSLIVPTTYRSIYGATDYTSGRATSMAVDPTSKNRITFGTADGGVWRSSDGGTTWTSIFDSVASQSIGAVGVDPNNWNTIYVGTGEGNFSGDGIGSAGLFKSTDGGSTWSQMAITFLYSQPNQCIRRIAIDPRDSNKVYAAGDGGLFYTINGGTSWTRTQCGAAGGNYFGTDVALDSVTPTAGNPSIVYVAFGYPSPVGDNGVYRSTNAAAAWTKISTGPGGNGFAASDVNRIALAISKSDPKQLYALTSNSGGSNLGIYYTANASAAPVTWVAKNTTTDYLSGQGWYAIAGAVDPANPARLVVGGLDDWLSTDNGLTLSQISNWAGSGTGFSHADHHFLVMPDSSTIYDANDGGMFSASIPATVATWSNKNVGLSTQQYYGFAQHPTDPTKFHGGLQDNGDAYYNGTTYQELFGGDGGESAWDSVNATTAYEEYVFAYIQRNTAMIASPQAWTCFQNFGGCACSFNCVPDGATEFIAPFTLDANASTTMYAGSFNLYKNTAARTGNVWSAISTDLTAGGGDILSIHSAKNNGTAGTIYVGTSNGKLQTTTNGGTNWTDRSTGLSGATVTAMTTDPTNGQKVLATVSGFGAPHVYRSTAGGGAWANITGSLPAVPFNCIVIDPADVNHAYAGSDFGIYENTAVWTGTTWTSLKNNLPAVAVAELGFNVSNGKLRAATHGRGIWELNRSALGAPKEDSPANQLRITKVAASTVLNVAHTTGCGTLDNTIYTGTISTLPTTGVSWSNRFCNRLNTATISFDPGATTNIYFVVVGNNTAGFEGSYGKNGSNGELPVAGSGGACSYIQDLSGSCP